MDNQRLTRFAKPLGLLLLCLLPTVSPAQTTTVVALTRDAVPDGSDEFREFSRAALNDDGQVAFRATVETSRGITRGGLFRGEPDGALTTLMIGVQPAPGGDGQLGDSGSLSAGLAINGAGQVPFPGILVSNANGPLDDTGIYRADDSGVATRIAREGDAAPDGNGTLAEDRFHSFINPAINASGEVVFSSMIAGSSLGPNDNGIFLGDGVGGLRQVARRGQAAPDGNGTFLSVFRPSLSATGDAVFFGSLSLPAGATAGASGIFAGDGVSDLRQLVRTGQAIPGGDGTLLRFGTSSPPNRLSLNDTGQTAFLAMLAGTAGGSQDNEAIYRLDMSGQLTEVVREGQAAPDGNGVFSELRPFGHPAINNRGQVAFTALLRDTAGSGTFFSDDNRGVFRWDEATGLTQIVRGDEQPPEGDGFFQTLLPASINDRGQVLFYGVLRESRDRPFQNAGLYLYDDAHGLIEVARQNSDFLDSQLAFIDFATESTDGFNNQGQVAYRFELADGRQGIAVWNPPTLVPEPTAAAIAVLAIAGHTVRVRGRGRSRTRRCGA